MTKSDVKEKMDYDKRLQKKLQILMKQFNEGKLKIASGLQVIESLKAVRFSPDGNIDLRTVDGLVRSMALAAGYFHDREELKREVSLAEIQNTYFSFLEKNFGHFYKTMRKRKLNPHDAGMSLSRETSIIAGITKNLSEFLDTIENFWNHAGDAAHAHVEDMRKVHKGVFGGDLFPSCTENIASKCGIYIDTIILPDPFLRSKELFKKWNPQEKAYYLIKHGLNLLQYKELACVDITPPIVVILPDRTAQNNDERHFIQALGRRDALVHAAKIFGRSFQSFDELLEYATTLDSIERVIAEVREPSRILFDIEWKGSFKNKLLRAMKDQHSNMLKTSNPGIIVASAAIGRMCVSNELLIKAKRLHGTPLIDAPTSWQYFVWKLEYDAASFEREIGVPHLHIVRGLQTLAENQMEWLGRVPPGALIEIRKTGAIKEIRAIMGEGVEELANVSPNNFQATSKQIFSNIHEAFKAHRETISKLSAKKWKFARSDIGSWLIVGTLAVTSCCNRPSNIWTCSNYCRISY